MPHLIHVGNSFGVRIPKAILVQLGWFQEDSNLVFKVTDEGLLISPEKKSREGWVEAFERTCKGEKEKLLLGETPINKFDNCEWEW